MPTQHAQFLDQVRTFDARPDRLDLRDLPYRAAVRALPSFFPSDADIAQFLPGYVNHGMVLDQGQEGACTGFGLAAVVNYLLWTRSATARHDIVSPHMLYHLARFYDEWPGESYEGSSCRGALKGWHKHGVSARSLWPTTPSIDSPVSAEWAQDAVSRPLGVYYRVEKASVVDLQAAIADTGAVYVSAQVHSGWAIASTGTVPLKHADLPVIELKTKITGGHAFALVGYNATGFIVQNSWGTKWGASGFAIMTYADWVANGTDAWAVALGVPVTQALLPRDSNSTRQGDAALQSARHFVGGGSAAFGQVGLPGWMGGTDRLAHRKGNHWTTESGYRHALITGNDGCLINRLPDAGDAAHAAQIVALKSPAEWFAQREQNQPWRVAIYAHGGLNNEQDGITRCRLLGPVFEANGIYPIFVVWKSGVFETIHDVIADQFKTITGLNAPSRSWTDKLRDAADRTLELAARNLLIRTLWSEMKENVGRSMNDGQGLDTMVALLTSLHAEAVNAGRHFELHLVGHSAGSFVAGRLLSQWRARGGKVSSCSLLAPACDTQFALDHFSASVDAGAITRCRFQIQLLSDKRELEDSVGPYGKSLLYLVSRALEREHKTPLIGLANAYDETLVNEATWHKSRQKDALQWAQWFDASRAGAGQLRQVTRSSVDAGPKNIAASHGSFDNSIDAISSVLTNILGVPPISPPTDLYYE